MKTIALACIAGLSWCVSGAVLDTAAFAKKSTIQLGGAKGDAAVADVPVAVRISPVSQGLHLLPLRGERRGHPLCGRGRQPDSP